ncbi:MAG: hypothetical protein JXA10_12885 [Anaerolineae bacterium]|nr:hypothetical protein [Anaerolineae bacterium]
MTKHIVPRFKLMLFYDLADRHTEDYYQFIMNEMIPIMQAKNVFIFRAFQTISGQQDSTHRNRQVEYVAEDLEALAAALNSEEWQAMEAKLRNYVTNYSRKIVRFRQGFQL